MEAKETVMSEAKLHEVLTCNCFDCIRRLILTQAQITWNAKDKLAEVQIQAHGDICFKAGARKVMEWVRQNTLACQSNTPCNTDEYIGFHKGDWQAFVEELLGVD